MNADPRVMEHFPSLLSPAESDAMVDRMLEHWERHGFGAWALEVPGTAPFIGFIALLRPAFETPFTPCVEIGWRIAAEHWGRGYATEAAREAMRFGFEELGLDGARLDEIVSFTILANTRSRRVMEKLGMERDLAGDFEHPRLPLGHPLRPHILYRASRQSFSYS